MRTLCIVKEAKEIGTDQDLVIHVPEEFLLSGTLMIMRPGRPRRVIPHQAPHRVVKKRIAPALHRSGSLLSDVAAHDTMQSPGGHHARFEGIHVKVSNEYRSLVTCIFLHVSNVIGKLCRLHCQAILFPSRSLTWAVHNNQKNFIETG